VVGATRKQRKKRKGIPTTLFQTFKSFQQQDQNILSPYDKESLAQQAVTSNALL
jgi:hypothetical protein